MVVEDDALTGTMLRINLDHEGYEVRLVTSAEQGLQALDDGPYALLVVDYGLPGMSGLDLVNQVRSMGTDTPVLMLTAEGHTSLKVEALDTGADDYLTKPFHVAELLARVRALLRRGRTS